MKYLRKLRRFVYPQHPVCLGCECVTLEVGALCSRCRELLDRERLREPLCAACGHPLAADGSCEMCARYRWLESRSVWRHAVLPRDLVHKLKFGQQRTAASLLAAYMAACAAEWLQGMPVTVSWITMPESRYRERGFDHAQLLAEQVAYRLGMPLKQVLIRPEQSGAIVHQVGSTAEQRMQNLSGTFAPVTDVSGTILLIDDVMTTGATAAAASQCLLAHGAARVLVLTATRALSAC